MQASGDGRRTRKALAKLLDRRALLLLSDLLVLLLVRRRLEPLPGQTAAEEVHENVTEGFEVVSSGLLCARKQDDQMS